MGLTGMPSYSQYERALEELDSIGVVRGSTLWLILIIRSKKKFGKRVIAISKWGVAAGFEVAPITWTQKRKGVDDLYKHLFRNK